MIRIVIIEDEKPAVQQLLELLNNTGTNYLLIKQLSSIQESVTWFQENANYDLILMDINLSDGLSFQIFKSTTITAPVIFITAYDTFYTQAFDHLGIDYLLKPLSIQSLQKSLQKYQLFKQHFFNSDKLMEFLDQQKHKRNKIIVRRGDEFTALLLIEVVLFFTENRVVYLIDKSGKKLMTEFSNLIDIEPYLDSTDFFRANRKHIINLNHIKKFKKIDKTRFEIEFTAPVPEPVIVSQGNILLFKKTIRSI